MYSFPLRILEGYFAGVAPQVREAYSSLTIDSLEHEDPAVPPLPVYRCEPISEAEEAMKRIQWRWFSTHEKMKALRRLKLEKEAVDKQQEEEPAREG